MSFTIKAKLILLCSVFLLIFIMLFRPVRDVVRGTASDFFYPFFSHCMEKVNKYALENSPAMDWDGKTA